MSRTSRRGEGNAPAMFPFLAVLLCTIGALVLILVISVVNSHASAKREMEDEHQSRLEHAKEESDYLQSISDELASRREKVKQEIERRRRELANVEAHMARLQEQWNQLRRQAESIENSKFQDENLRNDREKRIAELRVAIDAKQQALALEVEKQKKRKPAFSIIPYDGPNGTSRRPVYLECRADGVIIQPEGIRVSMEDLKPPYGPGNPLDSALRVLRNAYQQRDSTFGLSIPPYPLLLVRPDGIHSYAMARAAMSGWDDQFGYELVDADMDLVFPPGIPSLANELTVTLEAAKRRQDLLIASLPKQYVRSRELDNIDFESLSPSPDGPDQGEENSGDWGDTPIASQSSSSNQEQGKWTMVQEIHANQVTAANPVGSGVGSTPGGTRSEGNNASSPSGNALSSVGQWGGADLTGQYESVAGQAPTAMQNVATAPRSMGSSASNARKAEQSVGAAGSPASGLRGGSSGTSTGGNGDSGNSAGGGAASGQASSGATSVPNNPAPNNPGMDSSRANAFSSGNAGGGSLSSSGSDSNMPTPEEQQAAPNVSMEWKPGQTPSSNSIAGKEDSKEGSKDGASGREKGDSDAKPIAASKGKGWATTRNDVKATPVSRPIRIVALQDRWLVRKEGSETQFDAEIELPLGPQQASRTLEKSIRDRVDSWGLSLPGGYWCPSITVESASDAQQSVQRLQRLLEGSGVDMRVIPLQAPPRLSYPPVSPSKR